MLSYNIIFLLCIESLLIKHFGKIMIFTQSWIQKMLHFPKDIVLLSIYMFSKVLAGTDQINFNKGDQINVNVFFSLWKFEKKFHFSFVFFGHPDDALLDLWKWTHFFWSEDGAGVNFTNVLHEAFNIIDSKSVKNTVKSSISFYAFRICERKSCT